MSQISPSVAPAETLRRLRWLLFTVAIAPIALYVALAWLGYTRTMDLARQSLLQASRIVQEHAAKVFQTNEVLLDRATDLVSQASVEEIHVREKEFHARLADLGARVEQTRAITVWDARGHPVASSRHYPVNHEVSIADRPFFIKHRTENVDDVSINEAFDGRLGKQRISNISRRLNDARGGFAGVISLSLSQDYFTAFYREVSAGEAGLAIALVRADGEVVARYPVLQAGRESNSRSALISKAISAGAAEGVIEGRSDSDDTYRIAAFRQVAPYPIYVAVSRTSDGVFDEWRHDLVTLALFFVPTSLALVLAISLALKKAKSEHDAVVRWHDETMRRTGAESQLRQLQKYEALGELTGGLAHDFNNLLSIVANNVAVMSLLPRGSDARPYLTAITRAVANGSGLTKHLLAFARKQPLTFVRIRTADAVPAICDLARHSLPKNITLKCDVVEDADDILADRAELELALINVTVNARDAMPDGGEIVVRVFNVPAGSADTADVPDVAKAYVAISISDTGTGISDAVMHRIFEPFFTTKKDRGTGLGLSRVYGYARQLGGNVTARNNAGGGAVITLYIPSARASASEDSPGFEIRIAAVNS